MKAKAAHPYFKKLLLMILMLLLCIPMAEQYFKYYDLKPLNGYFIEPEKPVFSNEAWFSGDFQQSTEAYLNTCFGFRNLFVRLYNQIYFSVFNHSNVKNIVIGKDNYLFEKSYINTTLGLDFIGDEKINRQAQKLKAVQDTLKSKDIDLLVVMAPGKATFYPEYIPNHFLPEQKKQTNYKSYKNAFIKNHINNLDLSQWFVHAKDTARFPLFPKTGIHWSNYGNFLAFDTILRTISNLNHKPISKLELRRIIDKDTIMHRDDDIEQSMNLLFDIKDLRMGYPTFNRTLDSSAAPSKVLTIADSFFWGIANLGALKIDFNGGEFWYYNNTINPPRKNHSNLVSDLDLIKEVEKNDVILLLFTDANLKDFGYGFIENLYDAYFHNENENHEY